MNKPLFTKKQYLTILVFIIALIALFLALSFLIKEEKIPRYSLWASLVFGTGSLITSILALSISMYSFRNTEKMRVEKLEEDANKFIKDNNEEIVYLPLCLIANSYDNHHKYSRKIYNEFNVLNRELQKEVLKQMCYEDYDVIVGKGWINKGIKMVKKFISDNDLGKDLLYDNAKYFHRSIHYSSMPLDTNTEIEHIMPDLFGWNPKSLGKTKKKSTQKISFDSYLISYLEAKEKNDATYQSNKDKKPIDVLASIIDFQGAPEDLVCNWMMQVVVTIAIHIISKHSIESDKETIQLSSGDAEISTYEDKYLEVLMELYNLNAIAKMSD